MGWLAFHWSPLEMLPTAAWAGHLVRSVQMAFTTNIFLISLGFTSGTRISLPRVRTSLLRCPCSRVTDHYGNPHAGPLLVHPQTGNLGATLVLIAKRPGPFNGT